MVIGTLMQRRPFRLRTGGLKTAMGYLLEEDMEQVGFNSLTEAFGYTVISLCVVSQETIMTLSKARSWTQTDR